jgi:hypothetical protein
MISVQSFSDRFLPDLRTRFLPIVVGVGVIFSAGIGYLIVSNLPEEAPVVDSYTQLLRTGVVDVTRPSPTDPNITEVVRFLPDGRVQVLERMHTKQFLSGGGRSTPSRESQVIDRTSPASPAQRAPAIADTFQKR